MLSYRQSRYPDVLNLPWIPGRVAIASFPGMTIEICNELQRYHTASYAMIKNSVRLTLGSMLLRESALYILPNGGFGNFCARLVLRPFHDDIAANQCHHRPSRNVPAFID